MLSYKILLLVVFLVALFLLFRKFSYSKESSKTFVYPLLSQADLILNNDYGEREKEYIQVIKMLGSLDKHTMSDNFYNQFDMLFKNFSSLFEELSSLHTSITAVCDCYRQSEDDEREYWEKAVKSDVEVYTELKESFVEIHSHLQEKYNELYRI